MNSFKYITTDGTYTFAGNELNRVVLSSININKTLGGKLTIYSGTTVIGEFAAGTPPRTYWHKDIVIPDLKMITTATEDITVAYRNI